MFYMNEVTDYRTTAPDGVYVAISKQPCNLTGALLVSEAPLVVFRGILFSETVDVAAKSFVRNDPHHCYLEGIQCHGDGAFFLEFGS